MSDYNEIIKGVIAGQAAQKLMTPQEVLAMYDELQAGFAARASGAVVPSGDSAQSAGEQFVLTDSMRKTAKKAIGDESVKCMECGKVQKMITKSHLEKHGLTVQEYLEKWGYPPKTKLIAKSYLATRSAKMREMKLWERRGKPIAAAGKPTKPKADKTAGI